MDYEERITAAELGEGEYRQEVTLRPQTLAEYIGQKTATDNLKIFIEAAKLRGEPLDHVLFYGEVLSYISGLKEMETGDNSRRLDLIKHFLK